MLLLKQSVNEMLEVVGSTNGNGMMLRFEGVDVQVGEAHSQLMQVQRGALGIIVIPNKASYSS